MMMALLGRITIGLADHWGKRHPIDRMRLASFEARAMLAGDAETKDALWREAERAGSVMVAREAASRRAAFAPA